MKRHLHFVFLGEFGYELLDWTACLKHIRNKALPGGIGLHAYSINNVGHLYSFANSFSYIGKDLSLYDLKSSGYASVPQTIYNQPHKWQHFLDKYLTEDIYRIISTIFKDPISREDVYISYIPQELHGFMIGKGISQYLDQFSENIYDLQAFWRKDYAIKPVSLDLVHATLHKYGLHDTPYILHQSRYKDDRISGEEFASLMLRCMSNVFTGSSIVNINYRHSLQGNSRSVSSELASILNITPSSFEEQLALIQASLYCVYTTCEDFGSHIYLPPLLGKDVFVLCDKEVLNKESYPIELWNEQIFRFGGQVYAAVCLESDISVSRVCSTLTKLKEYIDILSIGAIAGCLQNYLNRSDFLLWPNTPTSSEDVQERIGQYYGIPDYEDNCLSRPRMLEKIIDFLIRSKNIDSFPVIYEMCAGDGYSLEYVKKRHHTIRALASDIDKSFLGRRKKLESCGIACMTMLLQLHPIIFRGSRFDVIIMLNTFRDFNAAQLGRIDINLQKQLCEWLALSARYLIVSVSDASDPIFNYFDIQYVFPGEQESSYYLLSNKEILNTGSALNHMKSMPELASRSFLSAYSVHRKSDTTSSSLLSHLLRFSDESKAEDYPLSYRLYSLFKQRAI